MQKTELKTCHFRTHFWGVKWLTQNPIPYLSVVPDMKSPLSDIFSLAPLVCQNRMLCIRGRKQNKEYMDHLLYKNLANFHYISSSTANNQSNMFISNTNCHRIGNIILKTSEGFYQSQSTSTLTIPTAFECFQNSTQTYRDIDDRIPMWRGGSARKIIHDEYLQYPI